MYVPQVCWNRNLIDACSGRCQRRQKSSIGSDDGDGARRESDSPGDWDANIARQPFRDAVECAGIPTRLIGNKQKRIWSKVGESNISIRRIPEFQVVIDTDRVIGKRAGSGTECDLANAKSIFLNKWNAFFTNGDYLIWPCRAAATGDNRVCRRRTYSYRHARIVIDYCGLRIGINVIANICGNLVQINRAIRWRTCPGNIQRVLICPSPVKPLPEIRKTLLDRLCYLIELRADFSGVRGGRNDPVQINAFCPVAREIGVPE